MARNCIGIVSIYNRPLVSARFLTSLSSANNDSCYLSTLYIVNTHPTANSDLLMQTYSFDVKFVNLDSSYWWCSAMKYGISYALSHETKADRLLLMNDDLEINKDAFNAFASLDSQSLDSDILVGAVQEDRITKYGIKKVKRGFFAPSFPLVEPCDWFIQNPSSMYTFNANWVSISSSSYLHIGGLGSFTHAFGDLDLGLKAYNHNLTIKYFATNPIGALISSSTKNYNLIHKQESLGRHKPYERLSFIHAHFGIYYQIVEFFRQLFSLIHHELFNM